MPWFKRNEGMGRKWKLLRQFQRTLDKDANNTTINKRTVQMLRVLHRHMQNV